MEDIDKNEVSDEGISDDEDLMMREVVQGDADLFFLHHYLSIAISSACIASTYPSEFHGLLNLYS